MGAVRTLNNLHGSLRRGTGTGRAAGGSQRSKHCGILNARELAYVVQAADRGVLFSFSAGGSSLLVFVLFAADESAALVAPD